MQAMLATPGVLPDGPGWVYEMSWNGPRVLIDIHADAVTVFSPAGLDVTADHPEGTAAVGGIGDALLDGHLVHARPGGPDSFVVSDILRLYGVDLRARPYAERRDTLERLVSTRSALTVSPVFDDAGATEVAARQHGLAGVVAKRVRSVYEAGRTSPDWIERRFPQTAGRETSA